MLRNSCTPCIRCGGLRMADFGVLHRNELSGTLSGLTRVCGDLGTWDVGEKRCCMGMGCYDGGAE